MHDDQPSRKAREDVLRRVFDLSWRDQVEVYRVLGSFLEATGPTETAAQKQLRERVEAVDALLQATAHLKLAAGTAPTNEQYATAQAALGLPLSRQQIASRFHNKWALAKRAMLGETVAGTAQQRAIRRAASGRRREHEDYLFAVRTWLGTTPPERGMLAYSEWANDRNEEGADPPFVQGPAISKALVIEWDDVLRVAEHYLELSEARALRLEELYKRSGPLKALGTAGVALALNTNLTTASQTTRTAAFPRHLVKVGTAKGWRRVDVEAFRDKRALPSPPVEMQSRIVAAKEVATKLGIAGSTLQAAVFRDSWDYVPPPSGRISNCYFWLRKDLERWLARREATKSRSPNYFPRKYE